MNSQKQEVTWLHKLAGFVGYIYLQFVGKTSFVHRDEHPQFYEFRRKKRPAIYSFWHNNQVFLAYEHRGEPINVMVSRSKDGEYIAQVMKWMGLGAVRGSNSRGGDQALREMCSLIQAGQQSGFTPDGPKGPLQTIHGGVIAAARATQAPVIPTAVFAKRKITFNSWDKFFIPLPFNSIVVSHGKPLWISKDESNESAEEKIRESLNSVQRSAELISKTVSSWSFSLLGLILFALYSIFMTVVLPLLFPFLVWKYKFNRIFLYFNERFFAPILPETPLKKMWLHVASYGEWQALRSIYASLKSSGKYSFVITTNTPEARRVIAEQEPDVTVSMCPLDLPFVVERWVKKVSADALFILEKEIWPHLIRQSRKRHIPIFILNGRLSSRSLKRWKWIKPLSQDLFSSISWFFVRTPADKENFIQVGLPDVRIEVTGSTKYDNLSLLTVEQRKINRIQLLALNESDICVIGGSTWPGEEKALLHLFQRKWPSRFRLILAPRHLKRLDEIKSLLVRSSMSWSYWKDVKAKRQWESDILLVDTIGDLNQLYSTADLAFVGKSLFHGGGQSPMEPAAAGIPVVFGPSMENFPEESRALILEKGAVQIKNETEMMDTVHSILINKDIVKTMGSRGQSCIQKNQGGSARVVSSLLEKLGENR